MKAQRVFSLKGLMELLKALHDRGFNVGAVGSEDGGRFADHGISYFRYDLHRKLAPFADLRSCSQLARLFARHKPDVVHGFDPKPAIAAPLLAARNGVRGRVRTITGLGFVMTSQSAKARLLRPVYQFLQSRASAQAFTIFQNSDDQQYFIGNGLVDAARNEIVLGSGVNVEEMSSARPSAADLAKLRETLGISANRVVTMISAMADISLGD